jgi:benzodiazapine receptor
VGVCVNQIASQGQLRLSFLRWLLVIIPTVEFLGFLSGYLSNSGYDNRWFSALTKSALVPPGWVFATVWPILYLLIAIALATVLHARGANGRGLAITFFVAQFACNLMWSPLFFGAHEVQLAFYLALATLVLATITTVLFGRIRRAASLLMVPYLCWLGFASVLTYEIDRMNPDAERLVPAAVSTQI